MLKDLIIQRILQEGPITFETFMEMALYHREYGYYMRKDILIGREGDFYTAPHLHRLFGVSIFRQIEEIWQFLGKPKDFTILEMGAGMGYLAKDMLDYATTRESYPFIRYHIVEMNPYVIEKQRELLKDHSQKIRWYLSLDEIKPFIGCIVSNELLDSFPVHLIITNNGIKEIYIHTDGKELIEKEGEPLAEVIEYLREFSIELPDGFRTEVNLRIKDWLDSISRILIEGFVITIDYGYPAWQYYSEDYPEGTLQCYFKHQKTDNPYINIGLQDITSHVNFSALKKWAEEKGFRTIGYTSQGRFIVSMGIDEVIEELIKPSVAKVTVEDYSFEMARIKSLILPSGMGESHKVMIHYKGKGIPDLRGFKLRNELSKL